MDAENPDSLPQYTPAMLANFASHDKMMKELNNPSASVPTTEENRPKSSSSTELEIVEPVEESVMPADGDSVSSPLKSTLKPIGDTSSSTEIDNESNPGKNNLS
jgi:hypothetical protein